jgi:hypothetical protein
MIPLAALGIIPILWGQIINQSGITPVDERRQEFFIVLLLSKNSIGKFSKSLNVYENVMSVLF